MNGGTFNPILKEGEAFHDTATGGGWSEDGYHILDRDGDPYTAELSYDNGVLVDDTEHPNLLYWKYVNYTKKYHENYFAGFVNRMMAKNPYLKKIEGKLNTHGTILSRAEENGYPLKEIVDAVETFDKEQLGHIMDTMPSGWERSVIYDVYEKKFSNGEWDEELNK